MFGYRCVFCLGSSALEASTHSHQSPGGLRGAQDVVFGGGDAAFLSPTSFQESYQKSGYIGRKLLQLGRIDHAQLIDTTESTL